MSAIDTANVITLLVMLVSSALYALYLHFHPGYRKRHIWVAVMGGVMLVGGVVALRFTLVIPDWPGVALLWWAWWIITAHFCVSAIPVIIWQVWLDTYLQKEANGDAP